MLLSFCNKSLWTRVLLFPEATGILRWLFNPWRVYSVPLDTCHIIQTALINAIVLSVHWNSNGTAFLCGVIDHTVKAGINVKGISPFTAVTKGPFSIIFELLGRPFDNNKHCMMNTWRGRKRSHYSTENRILSVWKKPRQRHTDDAQSSHANTTRQMWFLQVWSMTVGVCPSQMARNAAAGSVHYSLQRVINEVWKMVTTH